MSSSRPWGGGGWGRVGGRIGVGVGVVGFGDHTVPFPGWTRLVVVSLHVNNSGLYASQWSIMIILLVFCHYMENITCNITSILPLK